MSHSMMNENYASSLNLLFESGNLIPTVKLNVHIGENIWKISSLQLFNWFTCSNKFTVQTHWIRLHNLIQSHPKYNKLGQTNAGAQIKIKKYKLITLNK
jgi:hypothetical protein